jgi:hypothetical protein
MFLVIGIPMLLGAAVVTAATAGLLIGGVINTLIGIAFVYWSLWGLRDIRRVKPDAPLPGAVSEQTVTELETTGIAAQGTITGFKYVAGSSEDGTTLVELELDVSTGRGETLHKVHKSRMPLKLNDRLAKGATVPVRVSTTDPSKLLVEWDGLVSAS